MTTSRDPERLIHAFVREGAEQLDDQVYDAVRAEIEQKRQRVVIGPWRVPNMSKLVPIGLGAAALIAVLFVGSRFVGSPSSNVGGPAVVASPTPASAEPTSSAGVFLPEGPYTVIDTGAMADTPQITVTIPSSGWVSLPGFGGIQKGEDGDPPQSAMLLWATPLGTGYDVYGDPCHWASTKPESPATTVDEIAAALAAQPSRDASEPVDVTVASGYSGKKITLHVPSDAVFADCDQETYASYGHSGANPSRTHQGPGQIDELWILNVNGAVTILDVMYRPDTPAALIDEMRAIAESADFGW